MSLLLAVPRAFKVPGDGDAAALDRELSAAHEEERLSRFPGDPDPFLLLSDALAAMDTPIAAFASLKAEGPTRPLSFEELTALLIRATEARPTVPPLHLIAAEALPAALDALRLFEERVATDPRPLVALLSREKARALQMARDSLQEPPPSQRSYLRDHPIHSPKDMDANWRAMKPHRQRAVARIDAQPVPGPDDIARLWRAASASGTHDPSVDPLLDRPGCGPLIGTFGLLKAVGMIGQAARFGGQGLLVVQY
jgi:hypothetical protein